MGLHMHAPILGLVSLLLPLVLSRSSLCSCLCSCLLLTSPFLQAQHRPAQIDTHPRLPQLSHNPRQDPSTLQYTTLSRGTYLRINITQKSRGSPEFKKRNPPPGPWLPRQRKGEGPGGPQPGRPRNGSRSVRRGPAMSAISANMAGLKGQLDSLSPSSHNNSPSPPFR